MTSDSRSLTERVQPIFLVSVEPGAKRLLEARWQLLQLRQLAIIL
jgi:hypothetical protein